MKVDKWIGLIFGVFKIIRIVQKEDANNIKDDAKHVNVKTALIPYFKGKGWSFAGDDVDRVINFVVWFIKKVVNRKR